MKKTLRTTTCGKSSEMPEQEKELDSSLPRKLASDERIHVATSPRSNFACVTLVFLEDWRDGRLSAEEVCETLLAASYARGLISPKKG